jgi:hypothetical protein
MSEANPARSAMGADGPDSRRRRHSSGPSRHLFGYFFRAFFSTLLAMTSR